MKSPAAILAARADSKDEGSAVPISPRRYSLVKKMFWLGLVFFGPILGLRVWGRAPAPASSAVTPSRGVFTGAPLAGGLATTRPSVVAAHVPGFRLAWVAGSRAGLVVDGVEYDLLQGECVGSVSLAVLGVQDASVCCGGEFFAVRVPVPAQGVGAGRVGAGSGGSAGDGQVRSLGRISAAPRSDGPSFGGVSRN